jgi:hypothetical protein
MLLFVYSDSKVFGCSALQAKIFLDFLGQSLRFSFNNVTVTGLKEILITSSASQANLFLENQPSDPYKCSDP